MKASIYIFTFYMLFMAWYPCLDIETAVDQDAQEIGLSESASIDHSSTEDHEHDKDHCSPFCMCHCCHTHVVVSGMEKLVMEFTGLAPYPHYFKEGNQESIQSVFRPPILA